jgi:hypothetical protein
MVHGVVVAAKEVSQLAETGGNRLVDALSGVAGYLL